MSYNRFFEVNEEQAFDFLENTINKIRTEEDIDTLTKLIKVFKKKSNLPIGPSIFQILFDACFKRRGRKRHIGRFQF